MTLVEWLIDQITFGDISVTEVIEQAKEMESYNAKVEAKKYYLKGFKDGKEYQIKLDELKFKSE